MLKVRKCFKYCNLREGTLPKYVTEARNAVKGEGLRDHMTAQALKRHVSQLVLTMGIKKMSF